MCYCLQGVDSSKEFYGVCDGKCPGNQADECGSTSLVTVYIGKVGKDRSSYMSNLCNELYTIFYYIISVDNIDEGFKKVFASAFCVNTRGIVKERNYSRILEISF